VAANDLTSATSAATTALQDIVSSSKLSSQTNIYDVEALLLVANLIGLGLDDLPNQAQILALCVKDYPTSPPVIRACSNLITKLNSSKSMSRSSSKAALLFLNEAVQSSRTFPPFEKAEILYNLAEFELSQNRTSFVQSQDKTQGEKFPLVSIERKLRQALSLLSPLQSDVLSLSSNICFSLGKLLHLHKGVVSINGVVGDDDGVHSCSEALKLYEKARSYGIQSSSSAFYKTSIDIHQAALLANLGNNFIAHERFRMALFPSQHSPNLNSAKSWLIYGSFLENVLFDIDGARRAYDYALHCSDTDFDVKNDGAACPHLALAHLHEIQMGDVKAGLHHLHLALSQVENKNNPAVLTAAAQFASEVDGDVVACTQFLETALTAEPGYGPALRWQGLLLTRAGLYTDAMKKLTQSTKWGSTYSPGCRSAALTTLAIASELDCKGYFENCDGRNGEFKLLQHMRTAAGEAKKLLSRANSADPRCRYTCLCFALLQLSIYDNVGRGEALLLSACGMDNVNVADNSVVGSDLWLEVSRGGRG